MKMTLNANEVINVVLANTAKQLGVEPQRLNVVLKVSGAADVYLDQEPDAPITRKRKAAPSVEKEVQQAQPAAVVVEETGSVAEESKTESVTEADPAVGTNALWG